MFECAPWNSDWLGWDVENSAPDKKRTYNLGENMKRLSTEHHTLNIEKWNGSGVKVSEFDTGEILLLLRDPEEIMNFLGAVRSAQAVIHLAGSPVGAIQKCARCGMVLQDYTNAVVVGDFFPIWWDGSVEVGPGSFGTTTDEPNCEGAHLS